jgi:hypothetical protein
MNPRPPQKKSRGWQLGLPTADVPEIFYRCGGQIPIKKLKKPGEKHCRSSFTACLHADISITPIIKFIKQALSKCQEKK